MADYSTSTSGLLNPNSYMYKYMKYQSDPLYYGQAYLNSNSTDTDTDLSTDTNSTDSSSDTNSTNYSMDTNSKNYSNDTFTGTNWNTKTTADDSLSSQRQYKDDSLVAHISPFEAGLLKYMGGSGTVNEDTGLLQFGMGDRDAEGGDEADGGGFNGGDRGMDAGSLGGEDRGGTGSSMDGSDYGGHGFSGGGDDGGSGRDSSASSADQFSGVLSNKFKNAYQTGMEMQAQAPSFAESLDGMSPSQQSSYMSNVADLESSPFGSYGLSVDKTPTSKAGSMFNQAKQQQQQQTTALNTDLSQGMIAAGYTDDMSKFFNTDWGKYNMTNYAGSTPQNALSSNEFASYVSNSPVALGLLSSIKDLETQGYNTTGMGITSGNQGKHAPNSQHYSNNAVDTNRQVNSDSFSALTSAMEKAGYNRGDKLGFGKNETMHFQ